MGVDGGGSVHYFFCTDPVLPGELVRLIDDQQPSYATRLDKKEDNKDSRRLSTVN